MHDQAGKPDNSNHQDTEPGGSSVKLIPPAKGSNKAKRGAAEPVAGDYRRLFTAKKAFYDSKTVFIDRKE